MPLATVVVTGASGLLGRAVIKELKDIDRFNIFGTVFKSAPTEKFHIVLDLNDRNEVESLFNDKHPQVLIHCAAERRPDVVENDFNTACLINVSATETIAQLCFKYGSHLVFVSTDYVFDGTAGCLDYTYDPDVDVVVPVNAYGTMKAAAEATVRNHLPTGHTILRIPVLYGNCNKWLDSSVSACIPSILDAAQSAKLDDKVAIGCRWKIEVDSRSIRYPTLTSDVARVLCEIARRASVAKLHFKAQNKEGEGVVLAVPIGTFHFSSTERWTKYEMSKLFASLLAVNELVDLVPVEPKLEPHAKRPEHIFLGIEKLKKLGFDTKTVSFAEWWAKNICRQQEM